MKHGGAVLQVNLPNGKVQVQLKDKPSVFWLPAEVLVMHRATARKQIEQDTLLYSASGQAEDITLTPQPCACLIVVIFSLLSGRVVVFFSVVRKAPSHTAVHSDGLGTLPKCSDSCAPTEGPCLLDIH